MSAATRTLEVTSFARGRRQLAYTAAVADLQFATSLWYDTVDFDDLEERYGADLLRRICFHIVAFDVNRLVSLKPDTVAFGPFADLVTPAFADLWRRILHGVWAQWRYENGLPDYAGPELRTQSAPKADAPASIPPGVGECRTLAFCGGGKDSLLAMRLLHLAGEPFDTLAYSHSVYGDHAAQHRLIDRLIDHSQARRRHRIWIFDDFLPSPALSLCPELGVRSITAAETPGSVFASLPVAMANGLTYLALAHEKSADAGNLIWPATGEEINHQWGKSWEAETLLRAYIQEQLLENVAYFSLLKPVYDAVIFSALRNDLDAVRDAHSCNTAKPWCGRCAKCAYVWLSYCAYLPEGLAHEIFGRNLFDIEENLVWFRQLLGLAEHTPFECVGQIEESRLALALCHAHGLRGRALDLYAEALPGGIARERVEPFFRVATEEHGIPPDLAAGVLPILRSRARAGRERVRGALGW